MTKDPTVNVRSIDDASAAVNPCWPLPRVRQKLRIDWVLVASAWANALLLGLRQCHDLEELSQGRIPDEVRLVEEVRGPQRLELIDDLGNEWGELGADEVEGHGRGQRAGLDVGRQGEDQRADGLHQRVDQGEVLTGVEEGAGQSRGHLR